MDNDDGSTDVFLWDVCVAEHELHQPSSRG